MTRKQRRLTMIGGSLAVLAVAAALVLNAMRDSIVFFSTPTMAAEKPVPVGKRFRLGGLVQPGSLVRGDNLAVTFEVADGGAKLPVTYKGILPDLFREGQGVVAEGALDANGVFKADTVLAKHDENYMPKEVADSLKKQGHWKDDYDKKPGAAATGAQGAATQGASTAPRSVTDAKQGVLR
jgi:cytochrome c-type biogenesis protein CcmE